MVFEFEVRSSLTAVPVLCVDSNVLASGHGMPVPVTAETTHFVLYPSHSFSSMSGNLF